ncbi:hypothetical protein [Streptosporangium carneum]|uniref:Lipoprotein n=1 Tax=Streptosporangium carneum TaxID=47481 RepID=A0A9W6HWW4_9ACTN|nr:hypothetical protein [Streptosporangium carneum]GLK07088.1 hypothetical protein GCM10017600_04930 [Streptosporangium carneum]
MAAARRRIRVFLVVFAAVSILVGCSTTTTAPSISRPQPTWHEIHSDRDSHVAADDVCPKGRGPRGLDCRSKAPGYRECVERLSTDDSSTVCQQALIVRVECSSGERSSFHSGQDCASSFESYVSCRTGTPKRSDDVCAGGEREFLRCPDGFDPASGFDCVRARDAYYECRGDTRGDDLSCPTYLEVLGTCRALGVNCSGLLDKYLGCGVEGLSPNECAFGLNMRVNCLRDLKTGVFLRIATCDSAWDRLLKNCSGSRGLDFDASTPCTRGANWDEVSYSICEKQGDPAETVGVGYANPLDGDNYRLPVCWAPEDRDHRMDKAAEHSIGERSVRAVHRLGETRYESM